MYIKAYYVQTSMGDEYTFFAPVSRFFDGECRAVEMAIDPSLTLTYEGDRPNGLVTHDGYHPYNPQQAFLAGLARPVMSLEEIRAGEIARNSERRKARFQTMDDAALLRAFHGRYIDLVDAIEDMLEKEALSEEGRQELKLALNEHRDGLRREIVCRFGLED